MKSIDSVVEIDAPQQDVWDTLTDFDSYFQWNPYITKAKGSIEKDGQIEFTYKIGGRESHARGKVALLRTPLEMRIVMALGAFGSLKMEHVFHVEGFGDQCAFAQRQNFSGLFASDRRIEKVSESTIAAFEAMNSALKERVESRVRARAAH